MGLLERFNTNHNYITTPPQSIEIGSCEPKAKRQSGACLVIGTHPDWEMDYKRALEHYPRADICGVNEAVRLINCKHLVTSHSEKIDYFMELHKKHNKGKWLPLVHLRKNPFEREAKEIKWKHHDWLIRIMAGSAPFAAAVMISLGYEKVILCGCPMNGGGGYAFEDTHKGDRYDPRIGYEDSNHNMIRSWHNSMIKFKDEFPELANNIKSMSGKTKEIFGGLDG